MNKLLTYLLPVAIVIVAVLLYLFIPAINEWVLRVSRGWQGALWLVGMSVALALYYALLMGFRGRALGYAIAVILFTAVCIWLLANWEWFTAMLEAHLGVSSIHHSSIHHSSIHHSSFHHCFLLFYSGNHCYVIGILLGDYWVVIG